MYGGGRVGGSVDSDLVRVKSGLRIDCVTSVSGANLSQQFD
jgi:hypothetical protein